MKKQFILIPLLVLLLTTVCFAESPLSSPGPLIAVAVHVDTADRSIFGVDLLEAGVNRLIEAKFSLLMMDGMVRSGNQVTNDLKKAGITNFNAAEEIKLKHFGQTNSVSYILLLTLYPLDMSADIKAFDVHKGDFLFGKKITQPKEAESKSGFMDNMLSNFSRLIDNELDQIIAAIKP